VRNDLWLKESGDFEAQTYFLKPHPKCKINFHQNQNAAILF